MKWCTTAQAAQGAIGCPDPQEASEQDHELDWEGMLDMDADDEGQQVFCITPGPVSTSAVAH